MLALGLAGCTKPNPRSCGDGTCTDPAFPFCDVGGELEGTPETCVAVACEAGVFEACRGDQAITCNAEGTDFNLVLCGRGCEDGIGCRLCDPNETACTNGTVATCDASGAVVASESCALGCFEDEPRCREIDPSNGLSSLLDVAVDGADLILDNAKILTGSGEVRDKNGAVLPVTSVLLPAPTGGVPIRVLIADRVELSGLIQVLAGNGDSAPALAIVAKSDIVVSGTLAFWYDNNDSRNDATAGGITLSGCTGGKGQQGTHQNPTQELSAGSGGGGHATAGTSGGGVDLQLSAGAGGVAMGSPELIPLRGGCSGGDAFSATIGGTPGGGAVQLVSRTRIELMDATTINASGISGSFQISGPQAEQGGGAGGGILLEAPVVTLGAASRLLVNGGPGPGGNDAQGTASMTTAPAPGGICVSTASFHCSSGGDGAGLDGPATEAALLPYTNSPTVTSFRGGGGGGGLGYVRINTATGEHMTSSSSIVSGVLTTGIIVTR